MQINIKDSDLKTAKFKALYATLTTSPICYFYDQAWEDLECTPAGDTIIFTLDDETEIHVTRTNYDFS